MYVGLLALNIAFYFVIVGVYLRARSCSLYHPLTIYLSFHGVVFVLRPILSWYYDYRLIYNLYQFTPDLYAKDMALVVANVGLLVFSSASLYWGNQPLRNRFDRFSVEELHAMLPDLLIVALVLSPLVAWSVYDGWGQRSDDLRTLLNDRGTGITINTNGNGYFQASYLMGVTLAPLVAWGTRFRWWGLIPAIVFGVAQAGTGTRGPVISELVVLGFLYLYTHRRRWPEWRVVLLVFAGVIVFNFVGADRGEAIRSLVRTDAPDVAEKRSDLAPLEGMDFANLEFVEFLVDKIPRSTGTYEYFLDNLQLFTEPVPRVLWKNKPIGEPIQLFNLYDYGFPIGMTSSMPGEGWKQLGIAGVAIWCGLWGGICGAIYNRFACGRQTIIQVALYTAFLATLIVFYRDGGLLTVVRQSLFFVPPILLWAILSRMRGTLRADDLRQLAMNRRARQAFVPDQEEIVPVVPASARLLPRSLRHSRPDQPAHGKGPTRQQ